jgi:hypothetical protein
LNQKTKIKTQDVGKTSLLLSRGQVNEDGPYFRGIFCWVLFRNLLPMVVARAQKTESR